VSEVDLDRKGLIMFGPEATADTTLGRLDPSRHCRRGRRDLAAEIRSVGQTKTAPLPAPFLVHHWIVPTSTGAGGSDPLGHCDLDAIR
jgi:hypothetical protein